MPLDDRQLFAQYCDHGDVSALSELFDRTAPTLLRLALHLSRDGAIAEDLVQSTFLRAIEVRTEWDRERAPLPWLCGILHNRARHDRWQRERSPDPARLAQGSVADPGHAAAAAELDDAVDAAIADLPEVYRPVLRLHLVYGHQPAEIAHALERAPGTIRSQLARGLDLLRRVLPAGFAGAVAVGFVAERGLAAIKEVVVGKAAGVAAAAATSVTYVGGAALMKKYLVAVVAVALLTGGWFAWSDPAPVVPPVDAVPAVAAAQTGNDDISASADAANVERRPVADPTPVVAATGAVEVTCRWADDEALAYDVKVAVGPMGGPDAAMLVQTARTDGNGTARFVGLRPGSVVASVVRGGKSLQLEVVAGKTVKGSLAIPLGIHVRGVVLDAARTPVANAAIWLSSRRHNYSDGSFVATSDTAGQFYLRSVEPERFLSAMAAGRRSAVVTPVRGEIGTVMAVELVLEDAGVSLIGTVLDANGAPAGGARVCVGTRENSLRWNPAFHGNLRPPFELETDAAGSFAVHGLPPGSTQAVWVRAVDSCAWFRRVQLESEGETRLAVQLQDGATLIGRAVAAGADSSSGKAIAGVFVDYRSTAWFSAQGGMDDFNGPSWLYSGAVTDADGSYRIAGVSPGTLRLRARKASLEHRGQVEAAPGAVVRWDPLLAIVTLHGRVTDERGAALAGVRVTGRPPRGNGRITSAKTDAEGRFVCPALAGVSYVIAFRAADDAFGARPVTKLFGVEPGGEALAVTLNDADLPTAWITGVVLDRDGRPPAAGRVACAGDRLHWAPRCEVDPETGAFRLGPLPAGAYRLQARVGKNAAERYSAWTAPVAVMAHEIRKYGVLQMPQTGSITLRVTGPAGVDLDGVSVVLADVVGWSSGSRHVGNLTQGTLRITDIAPGPYRLGVGGDDNLPRVYKPVVVEAEQDVTVDAVLSVGVAVTIALHPVTEATPIYERFEWHRDGDFYERYENLIEGKGGYPWRCYLLPGSYEVSVVSETGKREFNRFVVGPEDPPWRSIPLRLP